MRVHHAGDDGVAAGIHHSRRWSTERHHLALRTGEEEPAVLHGERLCAGSRFVDRVDARIGDDEVRRRARLGVQCERSEEGERGEGK